MILNNFTLSNNNIILYMKKLNPSQQSLQSLSSLSTLPNIYLIRKLNQIIKDQQQRLEQLNMQISVHINNTKLLKIKYDQQREYAKILLSKLEQQRKQINKLKIQVSLHRSDNLILKSKLQYREKRQNQSYKQKMQKSGQDKNNQDLYAGLNKQKLYAQLQNKILKLRASIKKLMKMLQNAIINNQRVQNQILSEVTQIIECLK